MLGFVFEPKSPRYVQAGPNFLHRIPNSIETVAVFGTLPSTLPEIAKNCSAIQWVSGILPEGAPNKRIKVLRMGGAELLPDDAACSAFDWLLLDAYHSERQGGTGETVDWEDAALIVKHFQDRHHVLLAGGLTPENVAEAIEIVHPFGVDVSSGVESSPGIKDHEKIRAFLRSAKSN